MHAKPTTEHQRLSQSLRLVLLHYWAQARQNWFLAVMAMIMPGIGTILVFYVPPLIIAKLAGRFDNPGAVTADAVPYVLAFAGVWALGEAFWRVAMVFLAAFEAKSMERLYKQSMDYLYKKDLRFFSDNFAGSLTKKTIAFTKNFEGVMDTLAFSVFSNIIPLFFIIYVLWQFSPWLVASLLGLLSFTILLLIPLIKRRQKLVAVRETASNVLGGNISDTITNMAAVHAFACEESERQRHGKYVEDFMKKTKRTWDYHNLRIDMLVSPLFVLTNTVGLVVAVVAGRRTGVSFETIFVTFSYFATFSRVLWEFNRIYRNLESGLTEAAQFTELLLDEPMIKDPDQPEKSHIHDGAIAFSNVTFQYADGRADKPLLRDFTMSIKPGEKIGLVGHSGGGKTTITRLLLRFMDIQEGAIAIDGQDIRTITQTDLRSQIAYVPQEPMLFHRSLTENISYGHPGASQQKIEEIAELAHAHEFIEQLAQGYDTLVGERGVKLSGGQRQRVAIARAMLKDAPILVLDEATSALDSESEVLIQDALWKLMEGRTAIVIAHRLSTIQKMDRILVMEKGRIVEEGTHKQLISKKGVYAGLWNHQSGGFLEE